MEKTENGWRTERAAEGDIKVNRVKRKLEKVQKQREHYKAEYTKLYDFLKTFPFYDRDRKAREEAAKERARVKLLEKNYQELQKRVEEQSMLIDRLNTGGHIS